VFPREQERGPLPIEVPFELGRRPVELGRQLVVAGLLDQLEGREEIVDPRLEAAPQLDLGPKAVGLAQDLLGAALVVPEAGLAGQRLELGDTRFLGLEVKDAPRSTESAPPGRERWTRPLVAGLKVLEQDRTELDQPKGGLAPGDDGVHAGTVAVVGADATVAVTVERCCVAAGSAITFTGNEIDE
jgi:hypothetical protein